MELPDGISYNRKPVDHLEFYLPYEVVDSWHCTKCNLELKASMIGENGRFEGSVEIISSESVVWHGKLPKKEDKARDFLKQNFSQRVSKHKGICK